MSENIKLISLTQPNHKTRIQYSDSDLVLYACPFGHYRFVHHPNPDLPPVDLAGHGKGHGVTDCSPSSAAGHQQPESATTCVILPITPIARKVALAVSHS